MAGIIVVVPLYCVAVLMSFLATRFGTTVVYGQSRGVYDHYFSTFLQPSDLMWSFLAALSSQRRVVVYDYPGLGGSTALPGRLTFDRLADDASGLLDAIGEPRRTCSAGRWAGSWPNGWPCATPTACVRSS